MRKKSKPFSNATRRKIGVLYKKGAKLAPLAVRYKCSIEKIRRAIRHCKVKMRRAGRPRLKQR